MGCHFESPPPALCATSPASGGGKTITFPIHGEGGIGAADDGWGAEHKKVYFKLTNIQK